MPKLTKEEMQALQSLLTRERPLCWYCEHCPTRRHKNLKNCSGMADWKNAVKSGECSRFNLAEGKLSGPREARPPRVEQLQLDFYAGYKASLFGEE